MSNTLRRASERELIRGLRASRRRALIERLRGNAEQRRAWDRAIVAFRSLERREVSRFELEQVERWLFEDLEAERVLAPARRVAIWRRWTVLAAAAATSLVTAAVALLWIAAAPEPGRGDLIIKIDELVARGRAAIERPLAIELMCGQPVRSAAQRGCAHDELLGFSVRLGDETLTPASAAELGRAPLSLSVFGIDAAGDVLYYSPTPVEPARHTIALGSGWQALPLSVRLAVNHQPGRVRVFVLAGEAPLAADELPELARALAAQPSADVDDMPWHLRLAPALLQRVCPQLGRCASAETELFIDSTVRPIGSPK